MKRGLKVRVRRPRAVLGKKVAEHAPMKRGLKVEEIQGSMVKLWRCRACPYEEGTESQVVVDLLEDPAELQSMPL